MELRRCIDSILLPLLRGMDFLQYIDKQVCFDPVSCLWIWANEIGSLIISPFLSKSFTIFRHFVHLSS